MSTATALQRVVRRYRHGCDAGCDSEGPPNGQTNITTGGDENLEGPLMLPLLTSPPLRPNGSHPWHPAIKIMVLVLAAVLAFVLEERGHRRGGRHAARRRSLSCLRLMDGRPGALLILLAIGGMVMVADAA